MGRRRKMTAVILLLSICLLNISFCPGAENETYLTSSMNEISSVTQMGALMGIIVKGERLDITDYFDAYLDISYYRTDHSDKKIASVTKYGVVKGKKAGIATIRAYNNSGTEIANRKIEVQEPLLRLPYISDLTQSCNALDYISGTTVSPDLFYSSKPEVAAIDYKTGEISVRKKGKTKITAYFGLNKKSPKISCVLKIRTGTPDMSYYFVDMGNGETKKIKGYFDAAMAKKIYNLVNDYRMQLNSEEGNEKILPFSGAYDDDSASQNALNTVAETRALEASVLFSHIRPMETSYYTAYNEEILCNRNYEEISVLRSLTGKYAGEDMAGGKNYDSAVNAFTTIKTHNTALMGSEYFDGLGVAVFVTNNKTKLTNGEKRQLKYHIVLNYIGPKKPSSNSGAQSIGS